MELVSFLNNKNSNQNIIKVEKKTLVKGVGPKFNLKVMSYLTKFAHLFTTKDSGQY